ncbi:hypothetical protein [Nocardia farcinica]|uniref:hypothetical protein n=1 Tax=Nocardia farcinica TaxID=37329 RepID=UPI002457A758|nr:hypothetical protein [Nocardia farcinica]
MSFTPTPVPGPDAPLKSALRYGLIGLAVLVVLSAAIAGAPPRRPRRWGARQRAAHGGRIKQTTPAG